MVTCGAGVPVGQGMAREEKQVLRTLALLRQRLWLRASGIVAKTHASGFRDRNGHLPHLGGPQIDGAGLCCDPGSGGIPGSHGSGHYGSREMPEHRSQGMRRKVLCEFLLAVLCGVPLKNRLLRTKEKSKDFCLCVFPSRGKIPSKAGM